MRRLGLRKTVSSGTPDGVSNAMLRLSARVLACSRSVSTRDVELTRFCFGPFRRSYPVDDTSVSCYPSKDERSMLVAIGLAVPASSPPRYRILVSNREMDEFASLVVVKSIVATYSRIWLTVRASPKIIAVLSASTGVTPQAFLCTQSASAHDAAKFSIERCLRYLPVVRACQTDRSQRVMGKGMLAISLPRDAEGIHNRGCSYWIRLRHRPLQEDACGASQGRACKRRGGKCKCGASGPETHPGLSTRPALSVRSVCSAVRLGVAVS